MAPTSMEERVRALEGRLAQLVRQVETMDHEAGINAVALEHLGKAVEALSKRLDLLSRSPSP